MRAVRPSMFVTLSILMTVSCGSVSSSPQTTAADGSLDCDGDEVVLSADIRVSGATEQDVALAALDEWIDDGASAARVRSAESWSALAGGREVAVAVPEQNGDGSWVVHDVRVCGEPRSGPARIDGKLDCDGDVSWTQQASFLPDTIGDPTPEDALVGFLDQWRQRYGGEIVLAGEAAGSLVVDGREQVVASASEAPAGGWLVATTVGCDGYRP